MTINEQPVIAFKVIRETDYQELEQIIQKAFDADTAIHTAASKGGPPGYDNGELLARLLQDTTLLCRGVWHDNQLIGFFSLRELAPENCELRMFCLHSSHHHQGIGTAVWQQIEKKYPYQLWEVETPTYSQRNLYFYTEKCGFETYSKKRYGDSFSTVLIKKIH